jgi:hypothetical protein
MNYCNEKKTLFCELCGNKLIKFRKTKDWKLRTTHKKCYLSGMVNKIYNPLNGELLLNNQKQIC